ncbi:prolyl 4-hydroxylase subunit alpha-1-like isoform X2 [Corticium candelabrum]|uniref:prolyl 4-hydroxylase subunit alpha-1-like isoform X2 n=1 Tax=Corticium candelabrum TaxID=121492 RepID=UPI002E26DD13|nr:prolyl 4-hydroxylase subunit alpha-1-like isoform X2 [Corticium candelabrum]
MGLLLVVLVSSAVFSASGELFSAIAHMENLVAAEQDLAQSLDRYLDAEQARLERVKAIARFVTNISKEANVNVDRYLGHPVNAYRLLRRFMSDWSTVENLVVRPATSEDFASLLSYYKPTFPNQDDLSGAATALMRLQNTYRIVPSEMVDGKIPGDQKEKLSSTDCYYLGTVAYEDEKYKHARDWMDETLKRLEIEDASDLNVVNIYDYLAYSEYKLGNVKRATRLTRKMISLEPGHLRAQANLAHYQRMLADERLKSGEEPTGDDVMATEEEEERQPTFDEEKDEDYRLDLDPRSWPWEVERRRYEKLCREPLPIDRWRAKHFKCFYSTGGRNPQLVLRPIAVEVAYIKPTVLVYRGVLSDVEMDRLKELASPMLDRATAYNTAQGRYTAADYRISKSAWLGQEHDNTGIVERINTRIEALTGLDMSTAEQLQVVNYGIGGHYEPHYDYARKGEDAFSDLDIGNRIATFLFYLSDVEAGGATVFPGAGARIIPSKGDATFWYNLMPSGTGDLLTRHAGCPVLSGFKWVCNKWIHERGQEFRRGCKINENMDWDIHVPET